MKRSPAEIRQAAWLLARPLQFLLYWIAGAFPRRDDRWVFGSWGGHRFADNAAAFFLFCQQRHLPGVNLVWISRRRSIVRELRRMGFDAYGIWSVRGVVECLRAGVFIFDCFSKDINHWLSRNATMVNLWSGVPLKTFERDIDNETNRYYKLFHGSWYERLVYGVMMPWHLKRPDMIIATSQETAEITRRAFDIPADAVCITGFPRNDVLVDASRGLGDYRGTAAEFDSLVSDTSSTFLYLPTFRDSGEAYIHLDWAEIASLMERLDSVFVVKLHPVDAEEFQIDHSRIVQLRHDVDVYEILPRVSTLISDYSSVIFDFMLLDRPIIYFVPDLEQFVSSSRSLNFDPEDLAVGPVCTTFPDLLQALVDVSVPDGEVPGRSERPRVMKRLHRFVDAQSSERVLREIERRVNCGAFPL